MKRQQEQEPLTAEGKVLLRIRKQMREQDKKKWKHPEADTPQISIAYVWRQEQWIPITWIRGTITPRKIQRLRTRYVRRRSRATRGKIGRKEILRIVELRVARRQGGAGKPPSSPIQAETGVRGTKLAIHPKQGLKTSARGRKAEFKARARRLSQQRGKLGRCDWYQCKHRAFWFVCYRDAKKPFGKRKVIRRRCTQHAWKDQFFPSTARNVFRIQRTPRKAKAAA